MLPTFHHKFIVTPILDILKEGFSACYGIGKGIETYPLCDYILQSIFLKMTGAQEQKLKCICWEIATIDYEFRNKYLNQRSDYGEFSTYDQKNNIFKTLWNCIDKLESNIKTEGYQKIESDSEASQEEFLKNIREKTIAVMNDDSVLPLSDKRSYDVWKSDPIFTSLGNCRKKEQLLAGKLKKLYENDVIRHRHRCAHNLTSYQQNLPTLDSLANKDYIYYNYYYRYNILILIDEIFIWLYNKYFKLISEDVSWR